MITCPVTGRKRYTDYCCNLRVNKITTLDVDTLPFYCAAHYVQIDDMEKLCTNNNFITESDMEL